METASRIVSWGKTISFKREGPSPNVPAVTGSRHSRQGIIVKKQLSLALVIVGSQYFTPAYGMMVSLYLL
jgi:hypothetical protein